MILNIYSIYDVKSESFDRPVYCKNDSEAKLSVYEAAKNASTSFHKYPADYTLFCVGSFDDSDCSISMHETKKPLGTVLEISISLKQLTLSEHFEAMT